MQNNPIYDETCPYCDSWNVKCGEIVQEKETGNTIFKAFCRDCGENWTVDDN